MPPKNFKQKSAIFLVKFFFIYAILQAAILLMPLETLQNAIAGFEASALGLKAVENVVEYGSHGFEIVANCTGLMSISVLAAVIFSLRKPELEKKIVFFAAGAAILFPLNLIRIYLVIRAAMALGVEFSETLHVLTWFTTSALILAIWYYFTKKFVGVKEFNSLL